MQSFEPTWDYKVMAFGHSWCASIHFKTFLNVCKKAVTKYFMKISEVFQKSS
jgi:hypothetical protein